MKNDKRETRTLFSLNIVMKLDDNEKKQIRVSAYLTVNIFTLK